MMQDHRLRATARAIYDACYPSEDWVPVGFDEAERFHTVHYRQAVGAAQQARVELIGGEPHPDLFGDVLAKNWCRDWQIRKAVA